MTEKPNPYSHRRSLPRTAFLRPHKKSPEHCQTQLSGDFLLYKYKPGLNDCQLQEPLICRCQKVLLQTYPAQRGGSP